MVISGRFTSLARQRTLVSDTNITTPTPNSAMARPPRMRRRIVPVVLAIVTILMGLMVHSGRLRLGPVAQDVLGDALWAALIAWLLGAIAPHTSLPRRAAIAFAVCVTVELSQLLHGPAIDALRRTTPGQLVLGSGFDPRDLVAYGGGVMAAALLESVIATWRETASLSGILLVTTLIAPSVMANQPGPLWVAFRYDATSVLFYVETLVDPVSQDHVLALAQPAARYGGGGDLLPLEPGRLRTFRALGTPADAPPADLSHVPAPGVRLRLLLGDDGVVPAVATRYVEQWGSGNPVVAIGMLASVDPRSLARFRAARSAYFLLDTGSDGLRPPKYEQDSGVDWKRTETVNRFGSRGELRLQIADAGWCVTLHAPSNGGMRPTAVRYCYGD